MSLKGFQKTVVRVGESVSWTFRCQLIFRAGSANAQAALQYRSYNTTI